MGGSDDRGADRLGVGQFDVLGTHTGTVEATELATAFAGRVRRVVLNSIPLFSDEQNAYMRTKGAEAKKSAPAADGSHLLPRWNAMVGLAEGHYFQNDPLLAWANPEAPGAGRHPWSPEKRQEFFLWSELGSTHLAYKANFKYPFREALQAIRQPLLVINTQDDIWQFTAAARPLLPPQAVYLELPDVDMLGFELHPQEMVGHISSFLDAEDA